jgi:thymidylate kinase
MLFSCLVDADFLDTEAYFDAGKPARRSGFPTLAQMHVAFDQYMAAKAASAPDTPVNTLRADILRCFEPAPLATTLFYASTLAAASREIASHQAAGRAVVLDRYFLSTCVYGEVVRPMDHPADLLELLTGRLVPPDVTVYLHADRDRRRERMRARAHIGAEDQLTFDPAISDRLDAGFRARAHHALAGHFLPVDTTDLDADGVVNHICLALQNLGLFAIGGGAA